MNSEPLLGIDLGGTNCRGGLVTVDGRIVNPLRMETRAGEGLESFFERLVGFCQNILSVRQGESVRAIGFGVPGIISPAGIVMESPNLRFLDGFPLAEMLGERFRLPVSVCNDVNAVGWGEALFGSGREFNSFVTVALGTGVGGSLVLDRKLWLGSDGSAGELGHIMVEENGRPCGCGSRGCLEQYASASGIVHSARIMLDSGRPSLLRDGDLQQLDSEAIAGAARLGDTLSLEVFTLAGERLGQVLSGIANLLNPDGVIVTGGAAGSLDLMLPAVEQELHRRSFGPAGRRLRLLRGQLGDDAGILGAAHLAMKG